MLPRLFWDSAILLGSTVILFVSFTAATEETVPFLFNTMSFNHEVRRNPKFIIPSLLAHMYQKSEGESVMNTILNRPFTKKVAKETDKKDKIVNGLEHKTITGNHKKDHMSQPANHSSQPKNRPSQSKDHSSKPKDHSSKPKGHVCQSKTEGPYIKVKESLPKHGHETDLDKDIENLKNDDNDGPIEVKKGFNGFNRNWYGESPILWAPPLPYPNSYVMPYHQIMNSPKYSSYHEPRPPDSMFFQGGVVYKPPLGYADLAGKLKSNHMDGNVISSEFGQKLTKTKSNKQESDGINGQSQQSPNFPKKNLMNQERKFIITNVTKYALEFHCPHCGGEISVRRAKNLLSRNQNYTVITGAPNTFLKIRTENAENKTLSQEGGKKI